MKHNHAIAIRSGLSWGIVLALCEVGFGVVVYTLLPILNDYLHNFQIELLVPVATVYLAYLFLLIAVYFACGMITAKWLSTQPLKSASIAKMGAISGAAAEAVRSLVAVPVNVAISLLYPATTPDVNPLLAAAGNAALRTVCGLPLFVVFAALVACFSAYLFSMIFFRPEPTATQNS